MNKWMKTVGITAALAVMIPLSAYAATSTGSNSAASGAPAVKTETQDGQAVHGPGRGRGGRPGGAVSQDILDLLKLDKSELKEKIDGGKTLAEVAEEQGVTRDALKQALTDDFATKQADEKQQFTDNLDSMVDGKLKDVMGGGPGKGGDRGGIPFGKEADLTAVAKLLGVTADELNESMRGGKSIADLAAEKKVDVQSLIDAEKAAIVSQLNQAVTDGKLTQEQADKQIADAAIIAEKIVNGKGFGGGGKRGHRPGGPEGAAGAGSDNGTAGASSDAASAES